MQITEQPNARACVVTPLWPIHVKPYNASLSRCVIPPALPWNKMVRNSLEPQMHLQETTPISASKL